MILSPEVTDRDSALIYKPYRPDGLNILDIIREASKKAKLAYKGIGESLPCETHVLCDYYFYGMRFDDMDDFVNSEIREKTRCLLIDYRTVIDDKENLISLIAIIPRKRAYINNVDEEIYKFFHARGMVCTDYSDETNLITTLQFDLLPEKVVNVISYVLDPNFQKLISNKYTDGYH